MQHLQDIKEQAHEEFDEIFSQEKTIEGRSYLYDKEAECSVNPLIMKDFIDTLIDKTVQMERERIVEMIINAGQNKISMLDTDKPRCELCHNGFTGTYWISQNDLIFALTGKYLSEYKESLITNKSDINK